MQHARKSSTVDAQILHILMDGKRHTQKAIAFKIDVSERTVTRGLERLRSVFIIRSFKGGRDYGGVYLDPQHVYYGLERTAV